MGCDIHPYYEARVDGKWEDVDGPHFPGRSYGAFAFLAGVRNYSEIEPMSGPRGLPQDVSADVQRESDDWNGDGHTHSWYTIKELKSYDYEQAVEDRRYTKQITPKFRDGGATCEPGLGRNMTLRDFLGVCFFDWLDAMSDAGAERLVFWFDN